MRFESRCDLPCRPHLKSGSGTIALGAASFLASGADRYLTGAVNPRWDGGLSTIRR